MESRATIILLSLAAIGPYYTAQGLDFNVYQEWSQIEYSFESEDDRSAAIANGSFTLGQVQPIDIQYTYVEEDSSKERIFITTPRLKSNGVPASLSVVTFISRDDNLIVRPYPSWSWYQEISSCKTERLVSAFRLWEDECGRLWVIDTGVVGDKFVCPPQILAFDLKTDTLKYRYEIPYTQYQNSSLFVSHIAEVEDPHKDCMNTWLYVADQTSPALLVYSLAQNKSWRVQDESLEASKEWSVYEIAGDHFTMDAGITTVALSRESDLQKKRLSFHAMSNINESFAYVKDLKNASNFERDSYTNVFKTYQGQRDQQSSIEAYDKRGNLYFSLLRDIQIARWNPTTPYDKSNYEIIGDNKDILQFPTSLKIGDFRGHEALWTFATAYQKFASGNLNGNEINFRILFTFL